MSDKIEKVRVVSIDPGTHDHVTTSYEKMSDVSDGYHTFEELYQHRMALTAALAKCLPELAWRSKFHAYHGEPMFEGFFIVGIDLPTGVITYHYKLEHWGSFDHVREVDRAPKWDGHTPADVIGRLESYAVQA